MSNLISEPIIQNTVKDAKYIFIFFKIYQCNPCNRFKGVPNSESPWNKIINNKELESLGVQCIIYEHGYKDHNFYRLPLPFSHFVTYGPYLYLYQKNYLDAGKTYPKEFSTDNANAIIKWIKKQIDDKSLYF